MESNPSYLVIPFSFYLFYLFNLNFFFVLLSCGCRIWCVEGVAVGCGWQAFVAYVNVGCYYIVGIPLGALLGFYFKFGAKVKSSIYMFRTPMRQNCH